MTKIVGLKPDIIIRAWACLPGSWALSLEHS